ncbi:hypothetical protein H5410_035127 [Solanum commersonii]|uniref:Uncharacterized protein n=1 Tax=Solanum commersonii TaxID=4109 RepID=A0A9J5Y207_SOLCO|nr:hypothetical protein H5410_035127 [Solanum commersonii]
MALVGLEGQTCSISIHEFSVIQIPTCFWSNFFMDVRYNLINGDKQTHFQVQTSPKVGKNRFYQIWCDIVHVFLVIWDFNLFCRIYSLMTVKTLLMTIRLIFYRTLSWTFVKTFNSLSWSRGANMIHEFLVIDFNLFFAKYFYGSRSLIFRDSRLLVVFMVKFFHEKPLGRYLSLELVPRGKHRHLLVQTSPK